MAAASGRELALEFLRVSVSKHALPASGYVVIHIFCARRTGLWVAVKTRCSQVGAMPLE